MYISLRKEKCLKKRERENHLIIRESKRKLSKYTIICIVFCVKYLLSLEISAKTQKQGRWVAPEALHICDNAFRYRSFLVPFGPLMVPLWVPYGPFIAPL